MPKQADRPGNRLMDRPEYDSKPKPLTASADTTVQEAARAMAARNFGSMIVVDGNDRVTGIATERDIMNKVVAGEMDPATTTLEQIMTKEPRTARETDDMVDWLRIMSNERFRRLPVVDADGRIQAIMTQGDFVSYTWPDLLYQMRSIATATVSKNWAVFLIGGGIALYSIIMIILVSSLT